MKRLFFLSLFSALAVSANAATIVWSGAVDNGFAIAGGASLLPVNSLVRLGYFNIDDSLIQANAFNIAYLNANFVQLDFDRIGGTEVVGLPGYFADREELNTGSTGLNIEGRQLVYWALLSSDNSSVAASIATATQTGIFYSTSADWKIPGDIPDQPEPGITNIDLTNLTGDGPTADLLPTARVVVGSYTSNTAGPFEARNFALAAVPEPSTAIVALLGGTALLLRRRRQS